MLLGEAKIPLRVIFLTCFELRLYNVVHCFFTIGEFHIDYFFAWVLFKDIKLKLLVVSNSLQPHGLYSLWNSLDHQNIGVGSLSLLEGIFSTQGSNPGVPHCRWFFTCWATREAQEYWSVVAYPFSSRSSWSRNPTRVSCFADGYFTCWAIREAHEQT